MRAAGFRERALSTPRLLLLRRFLTSSSPLTRLLRLLAVCPVCLEPGVLADPAALSCGHVFCWTCLSRCGLAGLATCPICRAGVTVDPVAACIDALLGGTSRKYDPRARGAPTPPPLPTIEERGTDEGSGSDEMSRAAGEDDVSAGEDAGDGAREDGAREDGAGDGSGDGEVETAVVGLWTALPSPRTPPASPTRVPSHPPTPPAPCTPPLPPTPPPAPATPPAKSLAAPPVALPPLPTAAEEGASAASDGEALLPADTVASPRRQLTCLSWNVAAISFPLAASPLAVALGLLAFQDWSDPYADVPLDAQSARARCRYAQQAEYIRRSGADLVLLQEVSGKATLDALLTNLGGSYVADYVPRAPQLSALAVYLLLVLNLSLVQFAIFEVLASSLPPTALMAALLPPSATARYAFVVLLVACRWRHSVITQYLLGSIAGQLIVLRRAASPLATSVDHVHFEPFGGAPQLPTPRRHARAREVFEAWPLRGGGGGGLGGGGSGSGGAVAVDSTPGGDESKPAVVVKAAAEDVPEARAAATAALASKVPPLGARALRGFFALRPRGVLKASVRLSSTAARGEAAGVDGLLTLLNTHLPHLSENGEVVRTCAELTRTASAKGIALFAGDLNPIAELPIRTQFGPIFEAGAHLAGSSTPPPADTPSPPPPQCHLTWDVRQPLVRGKSADPHLQLDYIFLAQPKDATAQPKDASPSPPAYDASPPRPPPPPAEDCSAAGSDGRVRGGALRRRRARVALARVARSKVDLSRREAFFVPGAPLSDHIGLLATLDVTVG